MQLNIYFILIWISENFWPWSWKDPITAIITITPQRLPALQVTKRTKKIAALGIIYLKLSDSEEMLQGNGFTRTVYSRINTCKLWINSSKLRKQDYPFWNLLVNGRLQSVHHHCLTQFVAENNNKKHNHIQSSNLQKLKLPEWEKVWKHEP